MSLMNVLDIAGSAMMAQSTRLNTTASNLANVDSVSSSIDTTYKARQPVFAAVQQDVMSRTNQAGASQGVRVLGIVESDAPARMEYRPNHPMADEKGYIYKPNVNVVEEMANMISSSRSYQTNVEMAKTAKDMLQKTLTLGQ